MIPGPIAQPEVPSVDPPSADANLGARDDGRDTVLRVGGSSPAHSLAAAISHAVYDGKRVVLRAIGAGAVNQAMKGAAVARGYVAQRGLDLVIRPGFTAVTGAQNEEVSAMIFVVIAQ